MQGCRIPSLLLAFLLILAGCSNNVTVKRTDSDQSGNLMHHIDKTEMSRLPDALNGSSLSDSDKKFITRNVSTGIYDFVSVKLYLKNGEQILEIDQFKYDQWIHSVTGERGKSPHGSRRSFKRIGGNWEMREVVNYGG